MRLHLLDKGRSVAHIGKKINDALLQIYAKEVYIIAGKHMQRSGQNGGDVFRFLPGKSKQTLLNDVGSFTEHFVACSRGLGFNIRVKETDQGGVSIDVTSSVSPERGNNLVERGC
jgi:hypothetical protein